MLSIAQIGFQKLSSVINVDFKRESNLQYTYKVFLRIIIYLSLASSAIGFTVFKLQPNFRLQYLSERFFVKDNLQESDVQNEAVKEIAEFAVNQQYGDSAVVNKIIEVSTQVVKGVNYEVLLEVAFHGKHHDTCIVEKFTIWDELGTKHLMSQELMPIDCEKHHIRQ